MTAPSSDPLSPHLAAPLAGRAGAGAARSGRRRTIVSTVLSGGHGSRGAVAGASLVTTPADLDGAVLEIPRRRGQWTSRITWTFVGATTLLLAFAYLLPQDLWDT